MHYTLRSQITRIFSRLLTHTELHMQFHEETVKLQRDLADKSSQLKKSETR